MEFIDGTDDVVFDNTYKAYVLLFTDYLASADGSELKFYISNDTGSSYVTSAYTTVGTQSKWDTSSSAVAAIATDGSMFARAAVGNVATETISGQVWIYNPSSTTSYPYVGFQIYMGGGSTGNAKVVNGVGAKRVAGAWDAFKILPNTGTIENLQATLYGITT